jgi:outer membrane biosynthesis protein TonB
MAILAGGVFYAPLPLIAQNGGGQAPLIPVADMPTDSGGAAAPAEPPLEVDSAEVPELVPPSEVGGGAEAPASPAAPAAPAPPAAATPAPVPAPGPAPAAAEPAQVPEEPAEPPEEAPTDSPTPTPDEDETDPEEFEEEFDDAPQPGQPELPTAPRVTAGPQLPRTGADLPALLLSGLSLTAAGMSLRALCGGRAAAQPARPRRKLPSAHAHARALWPPPGTDFSGRAYRRLPAPLG